MTQDQIDAVFSQLARLHSLYEAQESKIRLLRGTVSAQSEEFAALQQCLVDKHVLTGADVPVWLHRNRFAKTRGLHPLQSDAHLGCILGINGVVEVLLPRAGLEGMAALHATSRGAAAVGGSRFRALSRRLPFQLYVVGGVDPSGPLASVERYGPEEGAWEAMPPMLVRRAGPAAAAISGQIYVCGGSDGVSALSSAEYFSPRLGCWNTLPPMATARASAAAAVVSSRLYICGGSDGAHCLSSVEVLDTASCCWEAAVPMPARRAGLAARAIAGQVYVCGGCDGWERLSSAERLRPHANAWEALPPMSVRRGGPVGAVVDQRLHICGGTDGIIYLNTVEVFDPATHAWGVLAPMLSQRVKPVAAVVGGQLYVCGGAGQGEYYNYEGRYALTSAECFDPVARRWAYIQPLSTRRTDAAAASLAS